MSPNSEYAYLIKMPMDSVSDENIISLNDEYNNKQKELEIIKNTTVEELWLNDLSVLEQEYVKYKQQRVQLMDCSDKLSNVKVNKTGKNKKSIIKIVK